MDKKDPGMRKVDRRLTTIDGVDYWDAGWISHRIDYADNSYDVRLQLLANNYYNRNEQERINTSDSRRGLITIISGVILTAVTLFIALQFDYNLILQLLSSIVASVFLWVMVNTLIGLVYRAKELDNYRYPSFAGKSSFTFYGTSRSTIDGIRLTDQMGRDICKQLNDYRNQGDVDSYMEIVRKIVSANKAQVEKIKQVRAEEEQERELKQAEEFAKRNANNPFLSKSKLDDKSLSLRAELERFEKNSTVTGRIKLEALSQKLEEISKMAEEGQVFDGRAYEDCRRELENVTERFNETLEAGLSLSDEEVRDYQELVNNCTVVLERVSQGAVERRSTDAKISNIFLSGKYGVSRGDMLELESSLGKQSSDVTNGLVMEQADETGVGESTVDDRFPGDTVVVEGKWRL